MLWFADKGTGKKQDIKITGASTLAGDEVDRMVKDAEKFADEDKKKREAVDVKNQVRPKPLILTVNPIYSADIAAVVGYLPVSLSRCALWSCSPSWHAFAYARFVWWCTQADSLVYQTDKQLKDLGDKVPADVKSKVEAQIEKLKQVAGGDDTEATKKAIEDLQKEVGASRC